MLPNAPCKGSSKEAVNDGHFYHLQAFIWWQSTGTESKSGKEDSLYGLNLLLINPHGKVQTVVGFRQLTSGELEKHVKPEVQR